MSSPQPPSAQLNSARWIMYIVGGLTIVYAIMQMINLDKELTEGGLVDPGELAVARIVGYVFCGFFLCIGLVLLLFGSMIFRFPIICSVGGLLTYIGYAVASMLLTPVALGMGLFFRILIIIFLCQGVKAAFDYKREQNALYAEADDEYGGYDKYV